MDSLLGHHKVIFNLGTVLYTKCTIKISHLFFSYFCICVQCVSMFMCLHMCVCMHAHACVYVSQRSTLAVFYHSPSYFKQGLSLIQAVGDQLTMGSSCLYLLSTGSIGGPLCPAFYVGSEVPNSGFLACIPSTLPTEPSPIPHFFLFLKKDSVLPGTTSWIGIGDHPDSASWELELQVCAIIPFTLF